VRKEMEAYRLDTVVPELLKYIDKLCNWYLRMNRLRVRGQASQQDSKDSLTTLCYVLLNLCQLMAPLTPFIVETMYLNLRKAIKQENVELSVHFLPIPQVNRDAINKDIERKIANLQTVIELGRNVRDKEKLKVKQPLTEVIVFHPNEQVLQDVKDLVSYVENELNVKTVNLINNIPEYMKLKCTGDIGKLGEKFKAKRQEVATGLSELNMKQVFEFIDKKKINVKDQEVSLEDVNITWKFAGDPDEEDVPKTKGKGKEKKNKKDSKEEQDANQNTQPQQTQRDPMAQVYGFASKEKFLLLMNKNVDKKLLSEGLAREICNRIQKLRKKGNLVPSDVVTVYYSTEDEKSDLNQVFEECNEIIENHTRVSVLPLKYKSKWTSVITKETAEIEEEKVDLYLCPPQVYFNEQNLHRFDEKLREPIQLYIHTKNPFALKEKYPEGSKFTFTLDNNKLELNVGEDFTYQVKKLLSK